MKVDFERALKLLELDSPFTKEKLKKHYREKARENHPDNFVESDEVTRNRAEKKFKDIQAAYDFLKDYVSFSTVCENSYFDLDSYKVKKIRELEEKIEFDFDKYEVFTSIEKIIIRIIAMTQLNIIAIKSAITKEEIDYILNSICWDSSLKKLKSMFYKEYDIDKSKVKNSLNYNDNLSAFYSSLLCIKEKYSRQVLLIKEINRKFLEYKTYAGYDRIKNVIERIRDTYIDNIGKKVIVDICEFGQEVLSSFHMMYDYEHKINHLKEICSTIEDSLIHQKLEELENYFSNIESFSIIHNTIDELEDLICEYEKKQEGLKRISSYYGDIVDRYILRLQQLKKSNSLDEVYKVTLVFQIVTRVFEDIKEGRRNIEDLELLSKINFSNYESDMRVLKLKEYILFNELYIVNKIVSNWNELVIGKVVGLNENGIEMVGISDYGVVNSSYLSLDLFEKSYIPFTEFLEKSEFYGYMTSFSSILLYASDCVSLYYNYDTDSKFYFINKPFTMSEKEKYHTSNSKILSFQDKNIFEREIIEFLDDKIKKWKESEGKKKFTKK